MKVDDPISKGQKDHPRCVVAMCRRGVTGLFKKTDLHGLSYAFFERLRKKYKLEIEIRIHNFFSILQVN